MSDASGTSMLNVGQRKWSDEILSAMNWPRDWLPELTESTVASTKVSEPASNLTGLPVGTPIIAVEEIKQPKRLDVVLSRRAWYLQHWEPAV